jgi:hypothetical protein
VEKRVLWQTLKKAPLFSGFQGGLGRRWKESVMANSSKGTPVFRFSGWLGRGWKRECYGELFKRHPCFQDFRDLVETPDSQQLAAPK